MYITCEQCSTIFRLDETRLKPTGSKVRCSQCGNLFIARPAAAPEPEGFGAPAMPETTTPSVLSSTPSRAEHTFDQELEGIDLAELDSILEQDRSGDFSDTAAADTEATIGRTEEALEDLDEGDLDLDFESALELDQEERAGAVGDTPVQEDEEFDLDMDFELAAELPAAEETSGEGALGSEELDMDFELDEEADFQNHAVEPAAAADSDDISLGEDVEMALDDFEEALGKPEEPQVGELPDNALADEDLSLDMDLDLEEETASVETADEELELSLDEGPEEVGEQEQEAAADDLDLSDLGSVLDEETLPADVDIENEELELSLDEGPEEAGEQKQEAVADDLDLGDLASVLDEEAPSTDVGAENEELELSLDESSDVAADEAPVEMQTDDFDLTDLDDLLDEEDQQEEASDIEDVELSLDEDEGLGLEAEPSIASAGTDEMAEDDLDLTGLDDLLDDDVEAGTDQPENEDLELSLDDQSEPVSEKPEEELEGLEELEFELDAEFEDKPVSKTSAGEQDEESVPSEDEELDLSDIEQMLEDDTLVPETPAAVGDSGDDLMAAGAEKWVEDTAKDHGLGEEAEIDLSEIEAAIEAADDEPVEDIDLDEELELDLDHESESEEAQSEELELKLEMESESPAEPQASAQDDSEEIDLSDLDLSIEEDKPAVESEIINADDMELEFQIEEDAEPPTEGLMETSSAETIVAGRTTTGATTGTATGRSTTGFGQTTAGDEIGGDLAEDEEALIQEAISRSVETKKPEKKAPAGKKKGTSKSLVFVLILALLGGGGYFGYDYVMKHNIQIPYLSDFINPQPKDPNNINKLSTLEINSKFIENSNAGRLFVITGKVRNGYAFPCKMIRLQGKLFTKGKTLAKTERVYAGIMLSDQELATQELAQIKQRLETPSGQDAGVVAKPGQTIPFMVVFSDLPPDLDEFAVELLNSAKVQ